MEIKNPSPGDGLDREAALSRAGGDLDLLKDIARVFLDDCPRALNELHDAASRHDCQLTERAAHGLKGAASNFGAKRVVESSLRIETMGRACDLEHLDGALQSLEEALAALRVELESLLS